MKYKRSLPALLLCLGFLSGCGQADAQPSSSAPASGSPPPSQSEPSEARPEKSGADILRAVPYCGDAGKCGMTAEQALSYAQLLADGIAGTAAWPEYLADRREFLQYGTDSSQSDTIFWDIPYTVFGYSGEYKTDRANAILGDFAGDGQPYLCVLSSDHPDCGFDIYYSDGGAAGFVYGDDTYGGRVYTTFGLDAAGKMVISTGGSLGAASHYSERLALDRGEAKTVHSWYEDFNYDTQMMQVTEDGVDSYYTLEEWEEKGAASDWGELPDTPYTPIPLRDMIGYLNEYAAALGSSRSITAPERSEESRMALAMLSALEAETDTGEYDWMSGDARLVDLDKDGTPELVTYNGTQAWLHRWQDGQLQTQEIGWAVGGWVEWWLCRDTGTNELGIEYRCNGGGDFIGGTSTFYYFSHETSLGDHRGTEEGAQTRYSIGDQEVTQAEFDAARAQNQRLEELILESGSAERLEQTRAALEGMM